MSRSMSILASILLAASGAHAGDGVLEINQTCAIETGCFAGDAAGFPVTITGNLAIAENGSAGSKSFRLTSDLTVSSSSTTAIEVSLNGTRIDLGGFEIRCLSSPGLPQFPQPCAAAPAGDYDGGDGIRTVSDSIDFVSIRNGLISFIGDDGLALGGHAHVTDVTIRAVGDAGVVLFTGGSVEAVRIDGTGGDGIRARESTIRGSVVRMAGQDGIETYGGRLLDNEIALSSSYAIFFSPLPQPNSYLRDNFLWSPGLGFVGQDAGPPPPIADGGGNFCDTLAC